MGLILLGAFPPPSPRPAGPSTRAIAAPRCTAMPCTAIPEGGNNFKYGSYKDHDCK